MMKRVTWFVGGVAAGAVGVGAAKRKVRRVTDELAPVQIARRAGGQVVERTSRVGEALREGRRAMRTKEMELRARLEGRTSTLADELDDVDTVLVDGRPVEAGQVIVLRQVRDRQQPVSRSRRVPRRA
ncbi:unannotated protein [freshwater metagenome]|jgi:hypothetical protein|uniref:Unannotated protein n=1 Tax=freshwater metagenome TaxID=449393 RepID=A0A6J6DA73_9ZZZZ